MEKGNLTDFENQWREISETEIKIIQGEINDISEIRRFVYDYCACICGQFSMPLLAGDMEKHGGLKVGEIIPRQLYSRIERLVDQRSDLWPDQTTLKFDQAYIKCLSEDYLEALDLLQPVESYVQSESTFGFLQSVFFKTGQYRRALSFCQAAMSRVEGLVEFKEGAYQPGTANYLIRKNMRSMKLMTSKIPEFSKAEEFNPILNLFFSLDDSAEEILHKNRLKSPQDLTPTDLLKEAHRFHSQFTYLLPVAILYYQEYLKINPDDQINWFYLGAVNKLMSNYQDSKECLERALDGDNFDGRAIIALGDIFYLEKEYKKSEETFKQALEAEGFVKDLALVHLGYCREAVGDFRSALQYYEEMSMSTPSLANLKKAMTLVLEARLV